MPWDMPVIGLITVFVVAAALSGVACLFWRPLARRLGFLDYPSERSLHSEPMVRAGGLPIAAAMLLTLLLLPLSLTPAIVLALGMAVSLLLISTWDDYRPLPVGPRLFLHLLICLGFIAFLYGQLPGISLLQPLLMVVFALGLAWMTNLYNFMDGSDGLAGGQGLIGFSALAALALIQGAPALAVISLVIAGLCLGFLFWNFPPARLFLGDAGSIPLGFLAGAFALLLYLETGLAPWLALLPFAPFWLDASVTLLRRILAGEKFWRPHRSHFYQRLVRAGSGHRHTALSYYALMVLCGLAACIAASIDDWDGGLILGLLIFTLTMVLLAIFGAWIEYRFQRAQSGK